MHRARTGTILSLLSVVSLLPCLWIFLHLYKCFVLLIVRLFFPAYGKVFRYADYLTEEELKEESPPKASVVCSIELEGHLSLEDLRLLFQQNVLAAKLSLKANSAPRYPELKQCPASFMGYTFWKDVPAFSLQDHIWEGEDPVGQLSLSHLHEYMMNLPYSPDRSPWSIALLRQHSVDDKPKALLITRFHHSMADAKSILKLLVACLGQQPLCTAQPQPELKHSFLLYPFRFLRSIWRFAFLASKHWNHPWKNRVNWTGQDHHPMQSVRLSSKLLLNDLKEVGRRSGGTTSSVILALISGAVREVDPEIGKILAVYILPKPDHPAHFINHYTTGFLELPTDSKSPHGRLRACNKTFKELKDSEMATHLHGPLGMIGAELNPVRTEHIRSILSLPPVLITNIAGERGGFSVGGCPCSEFVFSVGTMESEVGLLFAISSYKEYCRVAVSVAGGVLSPAQTERIADGLGNELENLKRQGDKYESVIAIT